jgi:hypothetical protein
MLIDSLGNKLSSLINFSPCSDGNLASEGMRRKAVERGERRRKRKHDKIKLFISLSLIEVCFG